MIKTFLLQNLLVKKTFPKQKQKFKRKLENKIKSPHQFYSTWVRDIQKVDDTVHWKTLSVIRRTTLKYNSKGPSFDLRHGEDNCRAPLGDVLRNIMIGFNEGILEFGNYQKNIDNQWSSDNDINVDIFLC